MAANLTPQYLKAQEQYRRAASVEEELRCLEIMLREIPKHKASEKLQSDLKSKISRAKKDLEGERRVSAASAAAQSAHIPRQGAGTCVILGAPNVGKSQLLASLTRATPEIAPYPFTTRAPQPGMMPYEDVMVQLIDTPPITAEMFDPALHGIIRGADVALLVIDLSDDEGIDHCQALLDRLAQTKTRLGAESKLDEEDIGISYTRTLTVANKMDDPDVAERLNWLHELLKLGFPEFVVSAAQGTGLDELRRDIYEALDVVRVYSKLPTHKTADFERPFTVRRGGTVQDVAELVHRDLAKSLKFARVWGTGVHDGTQVKGDHVLHDRDIVELHA